MNTEARGLNHQDKEIVKRFVMKKMALLLTDPAGEQKIKEDKQVLEELDIQLASKDLQPLITATLESPFMDHENKQIKDGQGVRKVFTILADFFSDSNIWTYYKAFAAVKLGQYNFSDFHYVTTALKILDYKNWNNDSLNEETQQGIKRFYLDTIFNLSLSGGDKIYNLNILQHDLGIALSEQEETELSKHIKHNIMGLVDLIDQLRQTSFGVQPLVEDKSSKYEVEDKISKPKAEDVEDKASEPEVAPEKPSPPADRKAGKKKTFLGVFGKK